MKNNYDTAMMAFEAGKPEIAEQHARDALSQTPDSPDWLEAVFWSYEITSREAK